LIGRGAQIAALTRSAPRTLIHGDFRVDNLLFQGGGATRRCIVLDWESADIGCGLGDVAWLLAGCLPSITTEQEQRLLRVYHHALVAGGQGDYTWEACSVDYRRCMVEPFVQGVLSGTIWEPETVDAQDAAFATAIGSRFVAAAQRLALWEQL
jgi:Phosphotransferase enzyme family